MTHSPLFLKSIFFIFLISISQYSFGQYTTTECQTVTTSLIGPDRNDWSHNNLPIVNEGYLHNFDPPTLPCGINNPGLTSLVINIDLTNITTSGGCTGVPIFGNVLLGCPLTNTAVCPIIQDVLTPGCNTFGGGTTTTGMYSLTLTNCNTISATDIIGVDLIPATDFSGSCPSNGSAITDGSVSISYQICLDYTYDQAVPVSCTNTILLSCDDGDPCTINDMTTVDECDNSIVCLPCVGTLSDCSNVGCQTTLPCDDGDPCTQNDVETLAADGSVCLPCAGVVVDCSNVACQTTLPCDDGNSCTINDMETQAADGSICVPCSGILVDCSNVACQTTLPCDDGNPCTDSDEETLAADGSVCIPCAGILSDCSNVGCQTTLPCDDGCLLYTSPSPRDRG